MNRLFHKKNGDMFCLTCKGNDWKRLSGEWPIRKQIIFRCRNCGVETGIKTEIYESQYRGAN